YMDRAAAVICKSRLRLSCCASLVARLFVARLSVAQRVDTPPWLDHRTAQHRAMRVGTCVRVRTVFQLWRPLIMLMVTVAPRRTRQCSGALCNAARVVRFEHHYEFLHAHLLLSGPTGSMDISSSFGKVAATFARYAATQKRV